MNKCLSKDNDAPTITVTEAQLLKSCSLMKALGDPTRLRLIVALLAGERCVHELVDLIAMSQSAISHQLRVLRQADLVVNRKDGRHIYYSLADEHVRQIVLLLFTHVAEDRG